MFSLLSLFFACDPYEEYHCTEEFVYSSSFTLLDQAGNPINEADISYTVDGNEGSYVESFENGSFAVGGEEAGDFVVEISASVPLENDPFCWEVGTATLEYTIEAGPCHVRNQIIDVELSWETFCE